MRKYRAFLIGIVAGFLAVPHVFAVEIPKKLHFIWLGTQLPEKYVANIQAFVALNRDYEVNLWTDKSSRLLERWKQLESHMPVQVRDIQEIQQKMPTKMLSVLERERAGVYPNFAAASDILRLYLLDQEGGVYLDADNHPKIDEGFGTIDALYGFLFSHEGVVVEPGTNQLSFVSLGNDRIASTAGSRILKKVIRAMEIRHESAGLDLLWVSKRVPWNPKKDEYLQSLKSKKTSEELKCAFNSAYSELGQTKVADLKAKIEKLGEKFRIAKGRSRYDQTLFLTGPLLMAQTMEKEVIGMARPDPSFFHEDARGIASLFSFPNGKVERAESPMLSNDHWSKRPPNTSVEAPF